MSRKIIGIDIGSYLFNPSAKTITITGVSGLTLNQLLLITNVTRNIIIFNFAPPGKGGFLTGDILTLQYNTTSMLNTDVLQIYFWDNLNQFQIKDSLNNVINPAKEDGNLSNIKTNTDKLDINLSTRLSDSIFTGRVGEVQVTPTANTLLGRLKDIWDRLATVLSISINGITNGQRTMVNSLPVVIASDQSALPVTFSGGGSSGNVSIVSPVTPSGDVRVFPVVYSVPVGKTPISKEGLGSVSGSSFSDITYLIPTGQVLTIQNFEGGSDGPTYSSKVILYYAPAGVVNASSVILGHGYCAATNYQKSMLVTYTGNGTAAIIMRRQRLDGTAKEMYAKWEGYF